jgi:amidohydrolase
MHACGHDGHTAILLATARVLAQTQHRPNPITFVFQPAEEGGAGAEKLIRDGLLEGILGPAPDFFYGLHGWPEAPLGTITTRPGALLASTDLVSVTVKGQQAHAAFPHKASDPVLAASAIITGAQHIVSRRTNPTDSVVVSFTNFHAGTAVNVIPEAAMIRATVRCLSNETRAETKERLIAHIEHTALAHGCTAQVDWDPGYPVTLNDPQETRRVLETAQNAQRISRSEVLPEPTLGGEDFAFYAQRVPSCFFCVGLNPDPSTPYPGLHTPTFDFNDDAVPLGVEMMCRLALDERG